MLHGCAAVQKERGLLNFKSNPSNIDHRFLSLMNAIQKFSSVAMSATGDIKGVAHLSMEGINYVTRLPRSQLCCLIFVDPFPSVSLMGPL